MNDREWRDNGTQTREYGNGTSITQTFPFGVFIKARMLCADGVVRTTRYIASTADTYFSVPCSVKVKGKTVSGYLTVETRDGFET